MKLNELQRNIGATHAKKRVGRGPGSGLGKTCGRGQKGQKARSGASINPVFEGGQLPLYRRIPKRGFKNVIAVKYSEINVSTLNKFEDGAEVTPELLKASGLIKKLEDGVSVMGNGEITKKLTVNANRFTKTAKEKIEAAGGKAIIINAGEEKK